MIIFAPFPATIIQAIHRIFPLARGLFEDKVANFWCAANVLIKFRNLAPVTTLAKVALLMTFLAVLPGMMIMIWVSWTLAPSNSEDSIFKDVVPRSVNLLPYALFNSSMSFYLFSFQVHEKTILLPILPLMMIMSRQYSAHHQLDINNDWEWTCLISNVACFRYAQGLSICFHNLPFPNPSLSSSVALLIVLFVWYLACGHYSRKMVFVGSTAL